ncbi:hypothetical protein [Nonomuraea typhae]|uniref:MarR family transcriptional regulator n=1 Tax=Nonomuraea typhae TaxID=2603600 RepID=A0ABW7YJC9_9ACTN
MQSHGSTLSANYTKIANELLERADIDLAAKSLLGYLLMRKGWRQADIKTLSAKFGESQAKIGKWMRQLAEGGYLIRRKVRDAKGQWRTMVHAFSSPREIPGADMSSTTMEELADHTGTNFPSLGEPSLASPSVPPSGVKTGVKTPPTPEPALAVGLTVLRKIGQEEPRLHLNALEMAPLLPLVARWKARGATDRQIVQACTAGLPERVYSPAKLLATRLERKMPDPLRERVDSRTAAEATARPEPKSGECAECGRPMLRRCAHCEGIAVALPESLVRSHSRGIGLARKLLAQQGVISAGQGFRWANKNKLQEFAT